MHVGTLFGQTFCYKTVHPCIFQLCKTPYTVIKVFQVKIFIYVLCWLTYARGWRSLLPGPQIVCINLMGMCEVVVHRSACFLLMNPQFHGYQDLALFIWKANDFFLLLHLHAWQQQITVNAQVEGTWCFVTIFVFYIFTCVQLDTYTSQPPCC